jgi:hypothetical protein
MVMCLRVPSASEVLCASVLVKSSLEIRDYDRKGSATVTLYPQKLALTSPKSGGRLRAKVN